MTPDEVRAMPAGPELDALAATMVMGWRHSVNRRGWSPSAKIHKAMMLAEIRKSKWPQTVGKPAKYWNFTSLRKDGWWVTIRIEDATEATVIIRVMGDLAHAITVAAILDVMGVE